MFAVFFMSTDIKEDALDAAQALFSPLEFFFAYPVVDHREES